MGATAIIGGSIAAAAVVGAGANLYAASEQSSAVSGAAQTTAQAETNAAQLQYNASMAALGLQTTEYNQGQAEMQPWLRQGGLAESTLGQLTQPGGQLYNTGYTQQQFQGSPLYLTMQQQQTFGIDQLQAQSAAGGMYGSGNMGTALTNYAQLMAGTYEPAAYSQYASQNQTLYNELAGLAGTGQTAATNMANTGQSYANTASQTGIAASQALAAGQIGTAQSLAGGQIGQGNIWANSISGVGNQAMGGVGSYLNYYQNQNLINMLGGNSGGNVQSFGNMGAYYSGN